MIDTKKEALESIINQKEITIVFQPIVSLIDGSILGHEALSRITTQSEIEDTNMLFTLAAEYNRMWDLELLCRTKTFEAVSRFNNGFYNKKLFINVNPRIIHDTAFQKGFTKEYLKKYNISSKNVIFEITERNVIVDMDGFISSIAHYRSQNYMIAIDDAGAGYSGLNLISDVNPDFIKLDMKLIRDINSDNLKYALVKGMVEFSKVSNTFLIAEGIETYEELETLVALGVQYGQGYLIQHPEPEIKNIDAHFLNMLNKINQKNTASLRDDTFNIPIFDICTYSETIGLNTPVPYVYEYFKYNPDSFGLCVVKNEKPIGIITKEKLNLKLSGYYGYALNQKKEVHQLMETDFLSVDLKTPISEVSNMALSRKNDNLYDFIVITENEKYVGTVTIKDLLQKTTEIKIIAAKHQNPLSGLPGNMIIEEKLKQCVDTNLQVTIAYLDIDNFKAYNDVYGFESGDLVIKLLADILKEIIPADGFVGHIGGDDFVTIFNSQEDNDYLQEVDERFCTDTKLLYNHEDIINNCIVAVNRKGELERFPLLALTTVTTDTMKKKYNDIYELTEELAELKKKAKLNKIIRGKN